MSPTDATPVEPGTSACPNCGAVYAESMNICVRCGAPIVVPTGSEFPPGTVIDDKYEVLSLLGVGGMGEVYKCRHLHLNAFRCIKVMRRNLLTDESFRMRFIREARVATQIQHPNIAVLHDFSTLPNGTYYMVWEFIDGTSVRQWATTHGRFPLEVAVDIALQVLAGLEHCHRRGLLHRDISPDNIMIMNDPEDLAIKIIDLGIAKSVSATSTESTTQVGLYVGNPKYSSPEQLGGFEEGESIDGRTDIYSLGVVLYEMLLGVPLFQSKTPQGYVFKHITQRPPRFQEIDADFVGHEALEQIVLKALEKDRANRWPTARDFAAALRRFQLDRAAALGVDVSTGGTQRSARLLRSVAPLPTVAPVTLIQAAPDSSRTVVKDVPARGGEDQDAWQKASSLDTFDAYEEFLRQYPASERSSQARARIEGLLLGRVETLELQCAIEELEGIASSHMPGTRVGDAARKAIARLSASGALQDAGAWSAAVAAATAEAWQSFLRQYPRSPRAANARALLAEATLFEAAAIDDSIDAWQQFLAMHPNGPHAAEAKRRLEGATVTAEEERAFAAAKEAGSLAAWRDYLRKYPQSPRADEARRTVDQLTDLEAARSADAETVWTAFLENWGAGVHFEEARRRVDELRAERLAFERAAASGTVAAIQAFMDQYPGGKRVAAARELMAEAQAFEKAAGGSLADIEAFLARHPHTHHRAEAEKIRTGHLAAAAFEKAKAADTVAALREFVSEYGSGDRGLKSRALGRIEELADQAYRQATKMRSPEALRAFLDEFPGDAHASDARKLLRDLQADYDIHEFLSSERPAEAVAALTGLEGARLANLIAAAESNEKLEHLAALASKLENRQSRKLADEARSRVADARKKRDAEAADWDAAESAGTSQKWRTYLKKNPASPRAALAREREERAREFEDVMESGSLPLLKAFVDSTTDERYRALAEKKLADMTRPPVRPKGGEGKGFLGFGKTGQPGSEGGGGAGATRPPIEEFKINLPPEVAARSAEDIETLVLGGKSKKPDPPAAPAVAPPLTPVAAAAGVDLDVGVPATPAQAPAHPRPAPVPRRPRSVSFVYYLGPIITILILVTVIGLAVYAYRARQEAARKRAEATARLLAQRPRSLLVLDAQPWGKVQSVVGEMGRKDVLDRKGAFTPYSLNVPVDDYTVFIEGPDGSVNQATVSVVQSGSAHVETTFVSAAVDPVQYFQQAGWR